MIAGLRGLVEEIGPDWLLLNVGGVVFQVHAPTSTLAAVAGVGSPVHLHTHLQVREDGAVLYGFAERAGLRLFQLLMTVNGVGPRSALALLAAMTPEELSSVIASEDTLRLSSVPGIGKRTAARISLELKDKVAQAGPGAASPPIQGTVAHLLAALTSLGYSSAEATAAVRSVPDIARLDLEDGLRAALKSLAAAK